MSAMHKKCVNHAKELRRLNYSLTSLWRSDGRDVSLDSSSLGEFHVDANGLVFCFTKTTAKTHKAKKLMCHQNFGHGKKFENRSGSETSLWSELQSQQPNRHNTVDFCRSYHWGRTYCSFRKPAQFEQNFPQYKTICFQKNCVIWRACCKTVSRFELNWNHCTYTHSTRK